MNNVTELNFESIKDNLKGHFNRPDSPFKDWDFEGSGLNYLLDILAYNTHYNAVNAHLTMNETFLDSAQIRSNVVSRAKLIGYTPRSATAPRAKVDVYFPRDPASTATSLVLEKGAIFETAFANDTYRFITLSSYEAVYENGGFNFTDVELVQGELVTDRYVIDSSNQEQKFTIEDLNIDTSTLNVIVYENQNSNSVESYISHTNYSVLERDTRAYFLSESYDGRYQIQFGNDIIGKKLDNLSVVEMSYIVTDGVILNGAQTFVYIGSTNAFDDEIENGGEIYSNVSPATGGDLRETIEEVRAVAPISYIAQDRALTEQDYEAIIRKYIPNIDSITVWGGQYNDPPVYGKVFVSIKPKDANFMTEREKENVLSLIRKKNVLTVTPEFIDPDYTFLYFEVFFRYNQSRTSLSQAQLEDVVLNAISEFNENQLQVFDKLFRYSNLLSKIDNSNDAILSSLARVYIYKEHTLESANRTPTSIDFKMALHGVSTQKAPIISSSAWRFNNEFLYLSDEEIIGDTTNRRIYVYRFAEDNKTKIKVFPDVGRVNIKTGKVDIDALPTDNDITIRVSTIPDSNDIVSLQRQLLLIDVARTSVIGSSDSSPSELELGSSQYRTFETIREV